MGTGLLDEINDFLNPDDGKGDDSAAEYDEGRGVRCITFLRKDREKFDNWDEGEEFRWTVVVKYDDGEVDVIKDAVVDEMTFHATTEVEQ